MTVRAPEPPPTTQAGGTSHSAPASRRRDAALVAAGILLSRVIGLVRQRVFGYWFGLSSAGDAFTAAFRIPNFLQNLFGEGVLSASFIPAYAGLLAEGDEDAADRLAGAILASLALVISVVVLAGELATPLIVDAIVGGFEGEKRALTIRLVRILFPGAGVLALSAWCLGILNSHRRFFLSYAAPVLWSLAMIATLLWYGPRLGRESLALLAERLAWGSVVGSVLLFAVQMPAVLSLLGALRLRLDVSSPHVRAVAAAFLPIVVSRGVVQISAFVDQAIASHLGDGAVTALNNAQTIYLLPISLFGMAVSASELPEMARAQAGPKEETARYLQERLNAGMRRIAFYVVPSAAAFLLLGDVLVGALFQTGRFGRADTFYVWMILAGSSVGLLAGALGRLDSSTYYAIRDTRTPFWPSTPKRTGSPCSSRTTAVSRVSGFFSRSKAPSLKMLQFCRISTNAAPLCAAAARRISLRCLRSESIVRATNVASAPSASDIGLKGWSIEPTGVDFVSLPTSDVGEYCPFVSP